MKINSSRKSGFTLVEIMIVVSIIGLLATMAIPSLLNARVKSQQKVCISNLFNIDAAKQQWALDSKAGQNATPQLTDIQPLMGRGTKGTAPTCPADTAATFATSYTINDLQTPPTCLILPGAAGDKASHRLPD